MVNIMTSPHPLYSLCLHRMFHEESTCLSSLANRCKWRTGEARTVPMASWSVPDKAAMLLSRPTVVLMLCLYYVVWLVLS